MTPEEYLEHRVDDQIVWYESRSRINKQGYIVLSMLTLVASACIPLLTAISASTGVRILIASLGAITAVTTGTLSLMQFRELWVDFRVTAEALKREKLLFQTNVPPYEDDAAFVRFVGRFESLITRETTVWQQRLRQPTASPEESGPGNDGDGH